jgi:DNA-binding XRE family transcriptional regulator
MTDPDVPRPPSWPRQRDDQQIERARLVADFRRRLASTGPVVGHDDLGGLMRTARSAARLSQRELAARSGVPERTLARIESQPDAGARWSTVIALLSGAGCRLQVLGPDGHPVVPWGWEAGLDEGGRHVPAHLSVSLPFDAMFHRRLSMVRLPPRLPLYRWSLKDRPDLVTPHEDGPMLGG